MGEEASFLTKLRWVLDEGVRRARLSLGPWIKRHLYATAFFSVLLVLYFISLAVPSPGTCSPDSGSSAYEQAVNGICAMGLPGTETKSAIDFAQSTATDSPSVYDNAEILAIESHWYGRGLQAEAVQGITLTQIQGGTALTALEPEDAAKKEIADIMQAAFRFGSAREPAKLLVNTKAFAEILFKAREATSDDDWYGEFLNQVNKFPQKAYAQLSPDGLLNIAAMDMASPESMSTVTDFLNSPAYTEPEKVFCSPPNLQQKLKLGLCEKGSK